MTDGKPDAWMSSAPGPFLSIRPGGPLDPTVAISAVDGTLVVDASWTSDGARIALSESFDEFDSARTRAHRLADQLAAGSTPGA
jgi:hypothetical protein